MSRSFVTVDAVRARVPLLMGIVGATGSGKTYSALRLATGMQRVIGGDIHFIDTEGYRGLYYADRFKYKYTPLTAPYNPLSYLAAIEHCLAAGAGPIIVDSMSHEHEGVGGVLDMHEDECRRLMKAWSLPDNYKSMEKVNFSGWVKPKQERNRLISALQQKTSCIILLFRAKEKLDVNATDENGKRRPAKQGFMPIGAPELMYELDPVAMLYPGAMGVPTWRSEMPGERRIVKMPVQFRQILLSHGKYVADKQWVPLPLDEEIGFQMASWSVGQSSPEFTRLVAALKAATTTAAVEAILPDLKAAADKANPKVKEFEAEHLRQLYSTVSKECEATGKRVLLPPPPAIVVSEPVVSEPTPDPVDDDDDEPVMDGPAASEMSAAIDEFDRRGGSWSEFFENHPDMPEPDLMIQSPAKMRSAYLAAVKAATPMEKQ